ncbi:VOC family protein [soil metagenome]
MGNRVVHFEIEATDLNRAKKFYEEALDWKMEQMGAEYNNYLVITTGDPKEPGGINGGMYTTTDAGTKEKEVNAYRCVISVDDVEKTKEDVKKAGGKILSKDEKADDIAGVGLYLSCEDSEGNRFTLLQASDDMNKQ